MILRDGHRHTVDHGPSAGKVDGLDSVNAMALRAEAFSAPVERRYLDAATLAAKRAEDAPQRRAPVTVVREPAALRASALRGAEATRRRYVGPAPKHSDAALWEALRMARGRYRIAGRLLGQEHNLIRDRVARRLRDGLIPDDIRELLAHPRHGRPGLVESMEIAEAMRGAAA